MLNYEQYGQLTVGLTTGGQIESKLTTLDELMEEVDGDAGALLDILKPMIDFIENHLYDSEYTVNNFRVETKAGTVFINPKMITHVTLYGFDAMIKDLEQV